MPPSAPGPGGIGSLLPRTSALSDLHPAWRFGPHGARRCAPRRRSDQHASEGLLDPAAQAASRRQHIAVETRQRLHQRSFRVPVLKAHQERCALCRLHHEKRLDAAHIVSDTNLLSPSTTCRSMTWRNILPDGACFTRLAQGCPRSAVSISARRTSTPRSFGTRLDVATLGGSRPRPFKNPSRIHHGRAMAHARFRDGVAAIAAATRSNRTVGGDPSKQSRRRRSDEAVEG